MTALEFEPPAPSLYSARRGRQIVGLGTLVCNSHLNGGRFAKFQIRYGNHANRANQPRGYNHPRNCFNIIVLDTVLFFNILNIGINIT